MYAKNMSEDEAIEWLEGVLTGTVEEPDAARKPPARPKASTAAKTVPKPAAKSAPVTAKPAAAKAGAKKAGPKKTAAAA
jgi:hypothetical protein